VPAGVQAGVKGVLVEPQPSRLLLQVPHGKPVLLLEEEVVHVPEAVLLVGAQRRFRRLECVGMDARQGELSVDDPQLVPVLGLEPLQGGEELAAVGALEVRELHEGHGSVVRPQGGCPFVGELQAEPVQEDTNAFRLAEAVLELPRGFLASLVPQELGDLRPDLVQRPPAHPAAVRVVERRDVLVGGVEGAACRLTNQLVHGHVPRPRLRQQHALLEDLVQRALDGGVPLPPMAHVHRLEGLSDPGADVLHGDVLASDAGQHRGHLGRPRGGVRA
jgi:hypothetical protein